MMHKGHKLHHWKTLSGSKNELRGTNFSRTLGIFQDILKSANLLHKQDYVGSQMHTTVTLKYRNYFNLKALLPWFLSNVVLYIIYLLIGWLLSLLFEIFHHNHLVQDKHQFLFEIWQKLHEMVSIPSQAVMYHSNLIWLTKQWFQVFTPEFACIIDLQIINQYSK